MVYTIKSKVLVYPGMNSWRFLVVPKEIGKEIKETFGKHAKGWGSIPVSAAIGKTVWKTSIFPDRQSGTYLLPLKIQIRKAEGIMDDDTVHCTLKI